MPLPSDILSRPADEAVRRVALSILERAREASARLSRGCDPNALGALREQLRRFELSMRRFGPRFGLRIEHERARDDVMGPSALLERSEGLAQLDDTIEVLHRHRREHSAVFTPHVEQRLGELERERRVEAEAVHPRIQREVLAWAERVAKPLGVISVELGGERAMPSYGAVMGGVVRCAAAELLAHLEGFDHDADLWAAEDVRKSAEALADLLGPVTASIDAAELERGIAQIIESSAAVRDAVSVAALLAEQPSDGSAHGLAHVLDTSLERLTELAGPGPSEALRTAVDALAQSLEALSDNEIEYKYLLRSFPPRAAGADVKDMAQGYVPGERLHERLRRVTCRDQIRYVRTVKLGAGLSRMEVEEETTQDVFDTMWPLTEGCRVHKERYAVRDGALIWTIDRFTDRDLVLAEVEVPSSEIAPSPPAWLAEYIVRDVTGDPAFVNLNLAR